MATIRKETPVDAPAGDVWSAFRDLGAVHTRLARGFVTDCRMDGEGARIVTFANGLVARELIVDVDDAARRLAYSARTEQLTHHHGTFTVIPEGPRRSRVIWVADLLPHAMAASIDAMMDEGARAMKRTLEASASAPSMSAGPQAG